MARRLDLGPRLLGQEAISWGRLVPGPLDKEAGRLEMDARALEINVMKIENGGKTVRKKILASAVLFSALIMLPALLPAKAQAAGIGARIAEQQKRIDQGIASGALTRREAAVLQSNLDRIKLMASNMRAANGGMLRPGQRARLNRRLDRNSAMIYNKKHNPIRRF